LLNPCGHVDPNLSCREHRATTKGSIAPVSPRPRLRAATG